MSSNKSQSGFAVWYNSDGGKRLVGVVYSLGAAVVIIGALFKIMHWPFAGALLSAGMITEAILFAIGVFEKPHKEYDWDKVFSFEGEGRSLAGLGEGGVATSAAPSQTMPAVEKIAEKDVVSLSEGIRNLSETARQLSSLSTAMGSAKEFAENMESASDVASKYAEAQQSLNKAVGSLYSSYETLNSDMNAVVDHTKQYAAKVGEINKNLSSLNAVYEIQLKNLQSQSEAIAAQTESTRQIADKMSGVTVENQKIQQTMRLVAEEVDKYKESTTLLTSRIAELNKVYGNMLNALN